MTELQRTSPTANRPSTLHSSGIGNLTRPRVGLKNSVKDHEIVIRAGMAFDFKPAFRLKREKMTDVGAKNRDVQLGEHFHHRHDGAEHDDGLRTVRHRGGDRRVVQLRHRFADEAIHFVHAIMEFRLQLGKAFALIDGRRGVDAGSRRGSGSTR